MAKYCPYCVSKITQGDSCPYCSYAGVYKTPEHHLKPGSPLHRRYLVGRSLREDKNCILYLGRDMQKDEKVTITEYYPAETVKRQDGRVSPADWNDQREFRENVDKFKRQGPAAFQGGAVRDKVLDVFEDYGTAYVVTPWIDQSETPAQQVEIPAQQAQTQQLNAKATKTGGKKKGDHKAAIAAVVLAVLAFTIFFVFYKPSYTVTFELNGGELLSGELVQSVKKGEDAIPPEAKNGRMALSWSGNWTDIREDTTISAEWTKVELSSQERPGFIKERTVILRLKDANGRDQQLLGALIDENGTVVTNSFLFEDVGCSELSVETLGGRTAQVRTIQKFDNKYDLAILETGLSNTPFFELSDAKVKVNSTVYMAGLHQDGTDSRIESGKVGSTKERYGVSDCFSVDTETSEDFRGTPVVDAYGELVGIMSDSYLGGESLVIKAAMLDKMGGKLDKTVSEFGAWIRQEWEKSWTPHRESNNTYTYYHTMVWHYQEVTGEDCVLSFNDLDKDNVPFYAQTYNSYLFGYEDDSKLNAYIQYLESMGFTKRLDENYDGGNFLVYCSEKGIFTLIIMAYPEDKYVIFTPCAGWDYFLED